MLLYRLLYLLGIAASGVATTRDRFRPPFRKPKGYDQRMKERERPPESEEETTK